MARTKNKPDILQSHGVGLWDAVYLYELGPTLSRQKGSNNDVFIVIDFSSDSGKTFSYSSLDKCSSLKVTAITKQVCLANLNVYTLRLGT